MKGPLLLGLGLLAVGSMVVAWAQVVPVSWSDDDPGPRVIDVGAVGIDGGALVLRPVGTHGPLTISSTGTKVSDPSCSAQNRGELRLKMLSFTGGVGELVTLDALCLCARKRISFSGSANSFYWSCFTSD